mmetsp:Transcript_19469/g.30599  ORF Transcript_19469/g.30599 Transcript_19469/m.30599 type:complete len:306 (-) Transcript_19469:61-978(-)
MDIVTVAFLILFTTHHNSTTTTTQHSQGNISNREGNDEQDPKSKRTKPSGIAERAAVTRRGRSQAAPSSTQAEAVTSEADKKPAAPTGEVAPTRRAPLRKSTAAARAPKNEANAGATKKEMTTAAPLRKVAPNKTAPTAAAVKREATKKKVDGAMKRSANDGNNPEPSGRASKRAKKSTDFTTTTTTTTVVKAAHMEIAPPSILDTLRTLLKDDDVSKVVCVPYFLSPGRHATEDVPQLIREAREVLGEEGLLSSSSSPTEGDTNSGGSEKGEREITVSAALGSHLESMLGAVDDLVEWALEEAE